MDDAIPEYLSLAELVMVLSYGTLAGPRPRLLGYGDLPDFDIAGFAAAAGLDVQSFERRLARRRAEFGTSAAPGALTGLEAHGMLQDYELETRLIQQALWPPTSDFMETLAACLKRTERERKSSEVRKKVQAVLTQRMQQAGGDWDSVDLQGFLTFLQARKALGVPAAMLNRWVGRHELPKYYLKRRPLFLELDILKVQFGVLPSGAAAEGFSELNEWEPPEQPRLAVRFEIRQSPRTVETFTRQRPNSTAKAHQFSTSASSARAAGHSNARSRSCAVGLPAGLALEPRRSIRGPRWPVPPRHRPHRSRTVPA